MLKQNLQAKLKQEMRLSPAQLQLIKLIEIPVTELEKKIKEEVIDNPALEIVDETSKSTENIEDSLSSSQDDMNSIQDTIEYIREREVNYNLPSLYSTDDDDEPKSIPIASFGSLYDSLLEQIHTFQLSELEFKIADYLIGSLDTNGYLQRDVQSIVDELHFKQNIKTSFEETLDILKKLQQLEPAGIGARNLQECLLLQLKRKEQTSEVELAIQILEKHYEEYVNKHYEKILSRLKINEEQLKSADIIIKKLNPKPGQEGGNQKQQVIYPDFYIDLDDDDQIKIILNNQYVPNIRINHQYQKMFQEYQKKIKTGKATAEEIAFFKKKVEAGKTFIEALQQRKFTLQFVMESIVKRQGAFFESEGDESKLKPMILEDVANDVEMDISTISRVANSKYLETYYGKIYPLKFFFSEKISTQSGEEVANKAVKYELKQIIEAESKKKPLSDEKIAQMLKEKGYNIARRTVAKYREQIGIPVARLRKEI